MLVEEPLDALLDDVGLLADALLEELEALEEPAAVAAGAFGTKLLLPVPNPSAAASSPLPSTVTISVWFLAVMTSFPAPLIEAVTKAAPALMALIRSATVSVPVDVYLVMLVPSLMLNVPPGRMPSVDNAVLVDSGTVPTPVAGDGDELEALEVFADVGLLAAPLDDEDVEDEPFSALCTSAEISLLTRLRAV